MIKGYSGARQRREAEEEGGRGGRQKREAEEGVGTYGANERAFSIAFFTTDGRASLFVRTYNTNRNMLAYIYILI